MHGLARALERDIVWRAYAAFPFSDRCLSKKGTGCRGMRRQSAYTLVPAPARAPAVSIWKRISAPGVVAMAGWRALAMALMVVVVVAAVFLVVAPGINLKGVRLVAVAANVVVVVAVVVLGAIVILVVTVVVIIVVIIVVVAVFVLA